MSNVDDAANAGAARLGKIQQGHVEYLQALLLRHEWIEREAPTPAMLQQTFDSLPALFEAYGKLHLTDQADESIERTAADAVQSFLRGHTAVVRNWGYFSVVKRISSEVLGAADAEFKETYGLTLTQLVSVFEYLVREIEQRLNDHRSRVHAVFNAGKPSAIAEMIPTQFPDVRGTDDLQAHLNSPCMSVEEARFTAFTALESILASYLFIGPESVAANLNLDEGAVVRLLKLISLPLGSLASREPGDIFLNNPVWLRPLIEVSEDVYFCALPQTLMSFVFPIVEGLAQPHPSIRKKLLRARASYLEEATERLLRAAFPGCEIVRGYQWTENGRQYESDLAMRYDATILLVDSKSGSVSWPALRGAPDRIVKHIQELVVAPSDQSGRLAKRLQEFISGESSVVGDFPISLKGVSAISRLSVTLHDFATVQSVPALLTEAGLIKSDYRLAPCMTLADLEVVLDILDTAYLRMHYLLRRAELVGTTSAFGDELDALGMYLDTGFNLGQAEAGAHQLMMVGYSSRVDRYYIFRDEGIETKKPMAYITPWIRALCDQLLNKSPPGWYEMAHALLGISHREQQDAERAVRSVVGRMRNGKPAKNGIDSVVLIPATYRRLAVVFQVRAPGDLEPQSNVAARLASDAFSHPHVELCALFAFRSDIDDMSYRSASLLFRTDRPVEIRTYL